MLKSSPLSSTLSAVGKSDWLVHRTPFYYGWVIMMLATFAMIMTTPGQTFGVSVFIEHFIDELGISRSTVSTLYLFGTLIGSMTLTYVGRLIDRFGPRLIMVSAMGFLGLTCLLMSQVNGIILLGIGFTLLRMLGQGSLSLVSSNSINQWWVRRRGVILGISGVATALFGMGAGPNLLNWMVEQVGWRSSYIILGLILLVIAVPVAYLFLRRRPEDFGLLPDGDKIPATAEQTLEEQTQAPVSEDNWTFAEAIRTRIYWVFTAGISSIAMLGTGLTFHIVSIFEDNGLTADMAAQIFFPLAITMAVVNLISGFLVERVRLRNLAAASMFFQALSLWMVPFLGIPGLSFLFAVTLGTLFGLMRTVGVVAWAKYFGRENLGQISGLFSTITAAASALGPVVMGVARDQFGNYESILNPIAILPLVVGIVCLFVDVPRRTVQ
ncbi:MAG: MFS transporter [Chloroflexota bacterium]